jgi:hypothetical protein
MQFNYGYMKVTPEKMLGLPKALQTGRWGQIKEIAPDKLDDKTSAFVAFKVILSAALAKLAAAWAHDADQIEAADERFDRAQRRFALELMQLRESDDAATRDDAAALAATTLLGNGFAQNALSYKDEVAFGNAQLTVFQDDKHKPLVAKLKLGGFVRDIAEAVAALEQALGLHSADTAKTARSVRVRAAHRNTALALDHIHGALDQIAHANPALREDIDALIHPLKSLLD